MADEKKIKFSGDASGLTSVFQKIKEEARSVNKELIQDALKYSQASKDQIQFIQDQIKAIERRNSIDRKSSSMDLESTYSAKLSAAGSERDRGRIESQYKDQLKKLNEQAKQDELQTQLLRELIDTVRDTAKEEIAEDRKKAGKTSSEIVKEVKAGKGDQYTEEQKLKAFITQDLLKEKKDPSMFKEMFKALTADRLLTGVDNALGLVVGAKSSEDIIKPAAGLFGMGLGGAMGMVADAIPVIGTAGGGAPFMARMGEILGNRFGDAYNRHIEEQERFLGSRNKLSAITNQNIGGFGNDFGLSQGQFMQLQEQVMRSAYSSDFLEQRSRVMLGLERGYGVDRGAVLQRFGGDVLTGQSAALNMVEVVGELERRGIVTDKNRLPLEDFLRKQTQLISQFSMVRERPDQNQISKLLLEFNKFGGGFDFTDPRSLSRIQNIHSGLSSPSNDFMQAANFAVLRQTLGPNASFLDIMQAQEQGLSGDKGTEFFKNTVGMISSRGGSFDNQVLSLRSRFPGMTIEQAKNILQNKDKFGTDQFGISGDDFEATRNKILSEGTSRVTSIERDTATIADAFTEGALKGIETVGELFVTKIESLIKQAIDKKMKEILPPKVYNAVFK